MEWIEINPLPQECLECEEEECYNCDTAGKRWCISRAGELRLRYKSITKTISRLERELDSIKAELAKIEVSAND